MNGRRIPRARVIGTRLAALLALAAFFATMLGIVISSAGSGKTTADEVTTAATTQKAKPPPPPPARKRRRPKAVPKVTLKGVAAYDPEGDGHENDQLVGAATDGSLTSFWSTEHYHTFFKHGVGLLLDAGKAVKLPRLTLVTETPGFAAEIRGASEPTGPFARISPVHTISGTTRIALKMRKPARYFLVWIVALPTQPANLAGLAHVNEVRAR
jgi:hypothetical protein